MYKTDMLQYSKAKQKQIVTMLLTLKILALFFSFVPFIQFFVNNFNLSFTDYTYSVQAVSIILGSVSLVALIWAIIENSKEIKNGYAKYLEINTFFVVIALAIISSGGHTSYYKYLFIFLIMAYTLECGLKIGLTLAGAASIFILCVDLYMLGDSSINTYFENDLALVAMFFIISWALGLYTKLEKEHIQNLTGYSNLDGLTGAYNHRYFYQYIKGVFKHSRMHTTNLSLLMIDLDYFKTYNDLYGHKKGDALLKEVTNILREQLRDEDEIFRYGGDEFCVILPDTDKVIALAIAQKLKEAVANYDFVGKEYLPNKQLSISVGLSTTNPQVENFSTLIEHADFALYRAKFLRKNRVEVYASIFDHIKSLENNKEDMVKNIAPLKTLISVINARDTYTYNHVERVVGYCEIISKELKLSNKDKSLLLYSAYLHDLGKINVSKETLISDTKLHAKQKEELYNHPQEGANIILQFAGLEEVAEIVLQHHERYDGTGYPNKLKGEEINYIARILTVVDSFDAMTNQRPYQKKRSFDEAFEEIEKCKGTQFDPEIAQIFIKAMSEV